jgi:PTH2 family peptidyl-tRNA hydrolase
MKQVIVVRKDLHLRKGKIAAQVAHASVRSVVTTGCNIYPDSRVNLWLETGMPKIVVGCNTQDELFQLVSKAEETGVRFTVIKDAGNTEVDPGTITCCAFGPDEDYKIDRITGELELL